MVTTTGADPGFGVRKFESDLCVGEIRPVSGVMVTSGPVKVVQKEINAKT